MKKFSFFLVLYCLLFSSSLAQHSISIRSGMGLGSNTRNAYLSPNHKISNKIALPQVMFPFRVHYRFLDYFGVEGGYQWSVHSINAINPRFRKVPSESRNKADDSVLISLQSRKGYHSLCLGVYGYIPFGQQKDDDELESAIYIGAGFLWSRRIGNGFSGDTYWYTNNNLRLDLNTQYANKSNAAYIEAGINYDGGKNNKTKLVFFAGIRYFYYSQKIMEGSYNVYNSNWVLIDHDEVHTNYGRAMFTFEIGRNILYKPKLDKLIPIHLHFPVYDRTTEDSLQALKAKNDSLQIARKQAEKKATQEAMGNRPVQITHILNVHTDSLILKVWDKQIIDGDIISINLNGKWVLENYSLVSKKKTVVIHLEPGENNLVLYAISEGTRKSCTVAVIFDDGHKQQQLLLDSDLKKSSAVQIFYVP